MASTSNAAVDPLPSYKHPPVDEVICGLRFEPLPQLKVPHIGLLWNKFRKEYPILQHALPIATDASFPVDQATGAPLPRIWFVSKADNELVQFQMDRVYYNWRHRGDDYPRYASIIGKFERLHAQFEAFALELELGPVKILECELTYINHIPKGQGWRSIDDLPKLVRDFTWKTANHQFLPAPANVAWQIRFPLPQGKGWLYVKLNQATRKADGVPVLVLELAARGLGEKLPASALRNWFDLAHEWIVRGFTDLTSDEIQKTIWKREI